MLVFDVLVFVMTLYKSLTLPRLSGRSLVSVLFRDGEFFFQLSLAPSKRDYVQVLFILGEIDKFTHLCLFNI